MGCMSPPRFPPDPARLVGWLALEDAEVYQLSLLLCPLESLSPWYLRMAKLLLAAGSGGPASCDPDLVASSRPAWSWGFSEVLSGGGNACHLAWIQQASLLSSRAFI